jgi:triacylglycerol lipase
MKSHFKISTALFAAALVAANVFVCTPTANSQVPPDIAAQLRAIGNGVCVPETAKIYKPLQAKAPYPGVTVVRDISYGPDPRMIMDVFAPEKGGGNRPVLIFVSGGQGNKVEGPPDGDAFYDNIMLWALKNGMTGVNMQRRGGLNGGGLAWDEPAKDVGLVVSWVRANIKQYKGNPNRIFLWSSSAGNGPVSTFASHTEISGENGAAVKGIILMSAPNFNILPETGALPPGTPVTPPTAGLGTNCGRPPGPPRGGAGQGAAPGGVGGRGGAVAGAGGAGRGGAGAAPVDAATQLARSNLPGLAKGPTAVFLGWGEIDPPNIITFDEALKAALCKAGRCPASAVFKDHSHMSLVFSPNTADNSVTGPILKWMKSVK